MLHILMNESESRKDLNIQYLSGYNPNFCILAYDDKTKKKCLFVASFEIDMFKGVKCFAFNKDTFRKTLLKYFKKSSIKTIGINKGSLSLNVYKRLKKLLPAKYVDNIKLFSEMRIIKSVKEISYMKKASRLTDLAFNQIVSMIKKKKLKTENDIYFFIKKFALENEVELAFDPVVATAGNAAKPHHIAECKKLKGFTVIDFGFRYKGYCTDMTRTIYSGKPSLKEIEMYNFVLDRFKQAVSMLKKGALLKKVDIAIKKAIGKKLVHSLGHGVGIEVHELPILAHVSKDRLKNGMVFTIEPGMYYKNKMGIRIEDTFAFTGGKAKSLFRSTKKLIVLAS